VKKNKSKISLSVVGKSVPIKDAKEKVTGTLEYAVDFELPGMVFGKILRSPHAHAKIKKIDTSKAEALSGVLGVVSYLDAPDRDWNSCWFNYRGHIFDEKVRFVEDDVAAVAATTEEIAEEALQLIEVEYDVLPAVFEPEEALKSDAPQVRMEGNAREPRIVNWGDVTKGLEESDIVVESQMHFASQQYAPIGRNACIAEWAGDKVTMWTSTQTPSECRSGIAEAFAMPMNKVRVIGLPSGCSFGIWWVNNFHMITVLLAQKIRRPVKIELTQEESFSAVKRRHRERSKGSLGCKKDGSIVFIDLMHNFDNGGYGFKPDPGQLVCDLWGRAPHGRFITQGASTNLLTAGCMRGVGDVTIGTFMERLLDLAAIQLNMDPLEFRLKNHIRTGDPLRKVAKGLDNYQTPLDLQDKWPAPYKLSSEALHECLTEGAKAFGWKEKWQGWEIKKSQNGPKQRGVGLALGTHCCGVEFEGNTSAIVRVHNDGSVTLCCSIGRQGQGSETTQAQIVAETLGIPLDWVEVEGGDTEVSPWSHGAVASNTAFRTGFATKSASMDAKNQILQIAARHYIQGEPEQLHIKDGMIFHRDHPNRSISLKDVMSQLQPDALAPPSVIGRPIDQMPPSTTFARQFAAHFVEVEVDTDTGLIRVLDYVATQDSGTVLNPGVLENQVIGGAIAGSGFALVESLVFDEETGKIMNPNFLDYKVLRAPDFPTQPKVIFCESNDPVGPYGAKGAGESPIAAPLPAISQAVYNAIGVWLDIPMTPEKVLKALGKI
jgi:CO/xanthine dehydrogenase Mo-binding subunit